MQGAQTRLIAFLLVVLVACSRDTAGPVDMAVPNPLVHWIKGPGLPRNLPRAGFALAEISANRSLVLWSGSPLAVRDSSSFSLRDDAWSTLTSGSVTPTPRTGHCAAYLPAQNQIVYVGGHDSASAVLASLIFPVGTPGFSTFNSSYMPSDGCAAATLPKLGFSYFFGGQTGTKITDETWIFDPSTKSLTRAVTTHRPTALRGSRMVFDAGNDNLVLFGGTDGINDTAEVWLFDGLDWGQIGTSSDPKTASTDEPRPLGRSHAAVSIDSTRRLLYVFGGNRGGNVLDDLWRLDLRTRTWERIELNERPSARSHASLSYDSVLDRMLLFGGMGATGELGDGWILARL